MCVDFRLHSVLGGSFGNHLCDLAGLLQNGKLGPSGRHGQSENSRDDRHSALTFLQFLSWGDILTVFVSRLIPTSSERRVIFSKSLGELSRDKNHCNLEDFLQHCSSTGVKKAFPQKKNWKIGSRDLSTPGQKGTKRTREFFFQGFSGFRLFSDSFSTFFRAFLTRGPRGPGNRFSDFFRNFLRRGLFDPCRRPTMSQGFSLLSIDKAKERKIKVEILWENKKTDPFSGMPPLLGQWKHLP